jgi:hypothetical protein
LARAIDYSVDGKVSCSRYELISTQEFHSTHEAADAFAWRFFGADIDGIAVDWST